jgi:hypothetical protein
VAVQGVECVGLLPDATNVYKLFPFNHFNSNNLCYLMPGGDGGGWAYPSRAFLSPYLSKSDSGSCRARMCVPILDLSHMPVAATCQSRYALACAPPGKISAGSGLGALLLWSATFVLARSLSEQLGRLT